MEERSKINVASKMGATLKGLEKGWDVPAK
jgi:hypothetical protein